MKDQPPSFFRQLFCKHEWERVNDLAVFANNGDIYPLRRYRQWECQKCRDIRQQKII